MTGLDLSLYSTAGFDRGAPRWKEALWILAKSAVFLTSLPVPSALRVAVLQAFGARIGKGVVIRSRVNITFPWRIEIGDHAWLGEEALVLSLAPVRIGSNVCISQRAFLCTGTHDFRRSDFALKTQPIRIEDGCWIAAQAFVGPGVTVGAGSIVSAGSVVLRDIPPASLARGNPATVVEAGDRREVEASSVDGFP